MLKLTDLQKPWHIKPEVNQSCFKPLSLLWKMFCKSIHLMILTRYLWQSCFNFHSCKMKSYVQITVQKGWYQSVTFPWNFEEIKRKRHMEQVFIGFIGWDRGFVENKFVLQCHCVCKVDNSEPTCSALTISYFCSLNILEVV